MKKFLGLFSAMFLMAALFCSCDDDNGGGDTITEQSLTSCFEHVVDLTTGATADYKNVGYQTRLNYTKATADVYITNLQTPDGTTFPTMALTNLKWKIDSNEKIVVTGTNVIPSISGYINVPTFSSFKLELLHRIIGESYMPCFCFNYTINNKYSIVSSDANAFLFGTTTSTSDSGAVFESKTTSYQIALNIDTKRLSIGIGGAQFLAGMPAMDIVFDEIPFTFDGSTIKWSVESLTPKIGGTPYPAFPITNLYGEYKVGDALDMDFICTPATAPGSYAIGVECNVKDTGLEE